MTQRLCSLLASLLLLTSAVNGKDKHKPALPEYVLRAQTVRVVIDPNAGEPLDQPRANATARDNVEKALMDWGRFRLLLDGQESDLVIVIRTGDDRVSRPTMRGGPIDQRPGIGQSTDGDIRMGGQQGQLPPLGGPGSYPQNRRPTMGTEVGPSEDTFEVYRGGLDYPLDSPPVWRYIKKDCLRATPQIPAVEEFRKALADAEKPKIPKTP